MEALMVGYYDGYYDVNESSGTEDWDAVLAEQREWAKVGDLRGWGRWSEAWRVVDADTDEVRYYFVEVL